MTPEHEQKIRHLLETCGDFDVGIMSAKAFLGEIDSLRQQLAECEKQTRLRVLKEVATAVINLIKIVEDAK